MEAYRVSNNRSPAVGITDSRVLREIRLNGRISRVDIARNLNLNKSTVTKIVADLMERGVIKVVAEGDAGPQGGRKPKYLTLDSSFGCILGVEIRTDSWSAVAVDLHGRVLQSRDEPLTLDDTPILDVVVMVVESMRERVRACGHRLIGVGLGLAGIIDHIDGIINQSYPLRVVDPIPVYEEASRRLGLPMFMDNDANCGCWAELAFPEIERYENFVFVLGEVRLPKAGDFDDKSVSVGLGIVVGGSVHHGHDFSAGEFRSILWRPGSRTQFSITDIDASHIRDTPELQERMFRELSAHIAFLVNTLNLDHVVFGDTLGFTSEYVKRVCREAIRENWSYSTPVDCDIRISSLGERAVAYGAAGMFLEHLFAIPDASGFRQPRAGVHLLSEIQRAVR
ncbi:MAG: ROK family transcriptional regulator [Spirochaetales bacterium]